MGVEYGQRQTSLYLVRRADALLGTLRFFGSSAGGRERLLQFLAQSDFWEWEVENLMYSFTNLADRQATWSSADAAIRKLGRLGIAVEAKLVRRVRWRGRWRLEQAGTRVAPVDLLQQVVDEWNALIDAVEASLITPMRDEAEKWNIQTLPNLSHLKKQMPELQIEEDEA